MRPKTSPPGASAFASAARRSTGTGTTACCSSLRPTIHALAQGADDLGLLRGHDRRQLDSTRKRRLADAAADPSARPKDEVRGGDDAQRGPEIVELGRFLHVHDGKR